MNDLVINEKSYTFKIDLTAFKLLADLLSEDLDVSAFTIPNVSDLSIKEFATYVNDRKIDPSANIYEIAILCDYFQFETINDLEKRIVYHHDPIERVKYLIYVKDKIQPKYVAQLVKDGWNLFDVVFYLPSMMFINFRAEINNHQL
ncbi:Hypothetical protein POVR1_LOCUS544 [uncultured virus]|nr:Hypothetical protein POVR1_LOCUS544 [uncultured virus]